MHQEKVQIIFNVIVPMYTPEEDNVFIACNLKKWEPTGIILGAVDNMHRTVSLGVSLGETLEYKYTRGSWENVEKDMNGGEKGNRILKVHALDSTTISDTVERWADTPILIDKAIEPLIKEMNLHKRSWLPHSKRIKNKQKKALTMLAQLGKGSGKVWKPLYEIIESKEVASDVRIEALNALYKIDYNFPSFMSCFRLIYERDQSVRMHIVNLLRKSGTDGLGYLLLYGPESKYDDVKQATKDALLKTGEDFGNIAIGLLKKGYTLNQDFIAQIHEQIGKPFNKLGEAAIDDLIHVLRMKEESVKSFAHWMLIQIGERAVDNLIKLLEDDAGVSECRYAASALGQIKDEKAVRHLIKAMDNEFKDVSVREACERALIRIGKPVIEPLVQEYFQYARYIKDGGRDLTRFGERVINILYEIGEKDVKSVTFSLKNFGPEGQRLLAGLLKRWR